MGVPPRPPSNTFFKEQAQFSSGSTQHQSNANQNKQVKSGSLVNTRLTGKFKPQLGSPANKGDDDNFDSDDFNASKSTVKFPHESDGKLRMLHRAYIRISYSRNTIRVFSDERPHLGRKSGFTSMGSVVSYNLRTLLSC